MRISTLTTYRGVDRYWYRDGIAHRDECGPDGSVLPGMILNNGCLYWVQSDCFHRHDGGMNGTAGPAIMLSTGTLIWYRNGRKHRDNGPAEIFRDGYEIYWKDGVLTDENSNPRE